ncbi:MAG: hypothetical protein K6U74_14040, partial [Firmicutes bacterium]|nr:hypothetical protein [Bacillota bacterium]
MHWKYNESQVATERKREGMTRQYFTKAEAARMVGKCVKSLIEFSGVPKGTTGTVICYYGEGNNISL